MPLTRLPAGRPPRSYIAVAAAAVLVADAVLAWAFGASAGAATPAHPQVSWTAPAAGGAAPPALAFAAAAYDADNSTVVLFGGVTADGSLSNQTWIWNGSAWAQSQASQPPPARELASLAFDPALHQLILYGGQGAGGALLDDTWAWNGASWVQLSPDAATPGPREAAAFAYDRAGNLLLFGGTGFTPSPAAASSSTTTIPGLQNQPAAGNQSVLADTWEWTASGWVKSAAGGPPARSGATLAYDRANGTTVLFGGESTPTSSAPTQALADTWVWAGSKWVQAKPSTSPPARFDAVFDDFPALGGPILLGGEGLGGNLADVWVWSGDNWVQASMHGQPPAREGASGAYDGATQEMVVFGGRGGGGSTLGDTGLVTVVSPTPPATTVPPRSTTTVAPPTTVAPGPGRIRTTSPTSRPKPATTGPSPVRPRVVQPAPVAVPPPAGSLLLETNVRTVKRGGTIWLSGGGFEPGSRILLSFHSTPSVLGWATAGPNGRFARTVSVPASAAPGEHHIVASGTTDSGSTSDLTATVLVVVPSHHRTSAFTTLFLLGLALLIPVATFLAMTAAGAWRRRRGAGGPAAP
ncbi:MAG TPA: hypothetical protein VFH58_16255 [Acidimicrobiales bacterium]|nr:hypothetical protein [Acidimicrobiales bacterium]